MKMAKKQKTSGWCTKVLRPKSKFHKNAYVAVWYGEKRGKTTRLKAGEKDKAKFGFVIGCPKKDNSGRPTRWDVKTKRVRIGRKVIKKEVGSCLRKSDGAVVEKHAHKVMVPPGGKWKDVGCSRRR